MSDNPVGDLARYVVEHTRRGTCHCGQCADHPGTDAQPTGHTADLFFFCVSAVGDPTAEQLRTLIAAAHHGEFCDLDPLDGQEHGYIEVGGWIGDQGLAMQFMGLCQLVGLGRVLQPNILPLPDALKQQMAASGMVTLTAEKEKGEAR